MDDVEKLYSPSRWTRRGSPEDVFLRHAEFVAQKSREVKQHLQVHTLRLSDQDEEESIDIVYRQSDSGVLVDQAQEIKIKKRKVFVWIHGGYWQWGSVKDASFMAENFANNEFVLIAVGYSLAPKVKVGQIVKQIERAVAKIVSICEDCQIVLSGHSAGGHLAAMMLHADLEREYKVNQWDQIKSIIPVSGVFDLTPLPQTTLNEPLKMDLTEAQSLSPQLKTDFAVPHETRKLINLIIVYGSYDSPAFIKQSEQYCQFLRDAGFVRAKCLRVDDVDHFDLIEKLAEPGYILADEIFKSV